MKNRVPDSTARLLFCETLLDEYESLEDQPQLAKNIDDIRTRIKEYRKSPDDPDKLTEKAFNGEILKELYGLMYGAQKQKAEGIRGRCNDANKAIEDAAEKTRSVDAAILNEVLGQFEAVDSHGNGNGNGNGYEPRMTCRDAEKLAGCTMRSALCLSGGGIRSATFNLGILQGLARHGLLEKFDYLSTVSGGGFVGGWLSAWIRRAGLKTVVDSFKQQPESPLVPDPHEVEYLRINSNYLSPRPGLLSADTWTLVATVFRNLVLNWLVFVPVFIALLLLPRIWTAIVLRSTHQPWSGIWVSLWIGFFAGLWALSYIGRSLPSSNDYTHSDDAKKTSGKEKQGPFITRCLLWLVVCAAALSVCLWGCYQPTRDRLPWWYYTVFMAAVGSLSWFWCAVKIHRLTPPEKRGTRYAGMLLAATIIIVVLVPIIVGFIASSVIIWALPIFHANPFVYSIFSVPLILLLMGAERHAHRGLHQSFCEGPGSGVVVACWCMGPDRRRSLEPGTPAGPLWAIAFLHA